MPTESLSWNVDQSNTTHRLTLQGNRVNGISGSRALAADSGGTDDQPGAPAAVIQ
jgi:hypothetical protein